MRNFFFYLCFIVVVFACTPKKDISTPSAEPSQLVSRVDSLLKKELVTDGPGGAVLILKNDSILFSKGYGLADLDTRDSITPNTLFNLGSISKTFVANGILILEQQGKLSLDDNLLNYFPEFRDKSIAEKIKIKHLLTHSSGLPDNRKVGDDTVFYLSAKDAENWAPEMHVRKLNFEPGTNYQYSNPAFNGLALIIEKVSGKKWQDFIRENIFNPSQMPNSTITDGPHPTSGVAHSYVKVHGQWTEDDYGEEPTFAAAGNGGVWSSLNELVHYERALRAASFLSSTKIEESRQAKNNFPVTELASIESQTWNLGWSWFVSTDKNGVKLTGHSGTQGGFYCNYVSVPEKKILFVMLANFPCDREKITTQVMQWIAAENYLDAKE